MSTCSCPASPRGTPRSRLFRPPPRFSSPIRPVPRDQRAQGLGGTTSHRGHRRSARRSRCAPTRTSSATAPTTGPPCRRTRSAPRPASSSVVTPSDSLEELSLRAARSALAHAQVGPEQIGAVIGVYLHQRSADTVGRVLAVRPVGHPADALLVRPRRRVRGPQLRAGRGHKNPATGSAAGARWCARKSSPTRSGTSGHRG